MSFKQHIFNAIIEAPSLEKALDVAQLYENGSGIGDKAIDVGMLKNSAKLITTKGTPHFFEFINQRGFLYNPTVFKSLLKAAIEENASVNLNFLLTLPHIGKIEPEIVQHNFLLDAVKGEVKKELVKTFLLLPWSKQQLNAALIEAITWSPDHPDEEVLLLLLNESQDALLEAPYQYKKLGKKAEGLISPLQMLVNTAFKMPNKGKGVLNLMVKMQGEAIFDQNWEGASLATCWIENAPEKKESPYVTTLYSAMTKANIRWWDGDPLNVLPSAIERFIGRGQSDFLSGFLGKTIKDPVEEGLSVQQGQQIAFIAFEQTRKKMAGHGDRMRFWNQEAPKFVTLFKDPSVWEEILSQAREWELSHPKRLNKEEMRAIFEKIDMTINTSNVHAVHRVNRL